jgi:outer membrane protein assembly factor BamB
VYSSPFVWENGDKALLIVHGNDYCTGHDLKDGTEVWRVIDLNPKGPTYNKAWRAVSSPLVTPNLIVVPSCKKGVTVGIDPVKALEVKGLIGPGSPAELWRIPKNTTDVPSPLLVDGIVYIFRETNTLDAYDAKTGQFLYSEPVTTGRNRGNPLYVDGKIILVSRDGVQAVVKPGKEFDQLAKNKLPDTFTSSPATANGRLYLRGWNFLWAIGTK